MKSSEKGCSVSREARSLMQLLETSGALRRGHFLLSSGLHSEAYVQCALLLEDPKNAGWAGGELAALLANERPDSVLSPALGGVIIGHEVASALGIPFRFTERKGETMGLHRGFELRPGERVVIVEDVITTGKSTRETAEVAVNRGAEVVGIGSIIDRSGGPSPFDVPFRSLLKLDLASYLPMQCPLCLAGGPPAEKPGSRPQRA